MLLEVNWAPVGHEFHFIVDGARKVGHGFGRTQHFGYPLNVEDQAVHPDWALCDVLVVLSAVLAVVVDDRGEVLDGVGFGRPVLHDNSAESAVFLIFGVSALIHEVVLIFVGVEKAEEVGICDHFEHVFAVAAADVVYFILFEFAEDADAVDAGVVEICRAVGHFDYIWRIFCLQTDVAVQIQNRVVALHAAFYPLMPSVLISL